MDGDMLVRGNAANTGKVLWPPPDAGRTAITLTRNDTMGNFDEAVVGRGVPKAPVRIGTAPGSGS